MQAGVRNLITDIDGLRVGNAADPAIKTGVTVLTADRPFTAAVHVMGGAPGTRETDALAPDKLVQKADALVLSGGSAFGLDAASGVMAGLRAAGRGFMVGDQRVPMVPAAILFDLLNGGAKDWIDTPYPALGRAAFDAAGVGVRPRHRRGRNRGDHGRNIRSRRWRARRRRARQWRAERRAGLCLPRAAFGDHGWGIGGGECAWRGDLRGGAAFLGRPLRDRSRVRRNWPGYVTTAPGRANIGQTARRGHHHCHCRHRRGPQQGPGAAHGGGRHDGMARAILPSHTPLDGDLVFAAATGTHPLSDPIRDELQIGHGAATCLARAIARGVYEASPAPGDRALCWQEAFSDYSR